MHAITVFYVSSFSAKIIYGYILLGLLSGALSTSISRFIRKRNYWLSGSFFTLSLLPDRKPVGCGVECRPIWASAPMLSSASSSLSSLSSYRHYLHHPHYPQDNILIIIITRPKPPSGRQGLVGSWGKDTVRQVHYKMFSTSHFAPTALSSNWILLCLNVVIKTHL